MFIWLHYSDAHYVARYLKVSEIYLFIYVTKMNIYSFLKKDI